MHGRGRALVAGWIITLAAAMACDGGGGYGPVPPPNPDGQVSAAVTDPVGDTFGSGAAQWDVTALLVERDQDGITARLTFSRPVIAPSSGDPAAMVGFLDLDLDQDRATGDIGVADHFRRDGGSTGMGVDARVNLVRFAADGSVGVMDATGRVIGRVTPVFDGPRVTIRIDRALLANDDGFVNAAAAVGIRGQATDMIPESGHLTLGATAASAIVREVSEVAR